MMEGIQVLNETVKWTADFGDLMFGVITVSIALALLVLMILALKKSEVGAGTIILIFCIVFSFSSVIPLNKYFIRTSYKEYQITISDNVKMTEFVEKYKVINQEGKIYTIVEKDIK